MAKSKMKRKSGNKPAAKKTAGKKAAATKMSAAKMPNFKDPLSKSGMIRIITDVTCVAKKDVVSVLECFTEILEKHVKTGGPGKFVFPGVMKITVVKKKAKPAREGVNPFTGEKIMLKAKPAYKAVKIKPLKKLKEMVA